MSRAISKNEIIEKVYEAIFECACNLDEQYLSMFESAILNEQDDIPKFVMNELIDNAKIADKEDIPICQDTGMVICFIETGIDVILEEPIENSINEAVHNVFIQKKLRKSIVEDPFIRNNTKDNTPAIIYVNTVSGNEIKVFLMLKGFGSENMSFIEMFNPADDIYFVADKISNRIIKNAPNACPPLFIGIGIGGTMDKASVLSKKALFRPIKERHPVSLYADIEQYIKDKVNDSNIGPAGYSGKTTVLSVSIEQYPTHIAGLPVAVTIQCHANRKRIITI